MTTNRIFYNHHPELDGPPPKCFPLAQWDIWVKGEKKMARTNGYYHVTDGYCAQCTPRYRDTMKAHDLCEHPNVRFYPDESDDLIGCRPITDDFGNLRYTTIPVIKEHA
jgi:hypothetical protein